MGQSVYQRGDQCCFAIMHSGKEAQDGTLQGYDSHLFAGRRWLERGERKRSEMEESIMKEAVVSPASERRQAIVNDYL